MNVPATGRTSATATGRRNVFAKSLFLALAFCAILAGLLAFHSSTGSHAFAGVPLTHSEHASPTASVDTTTSQDVAPAALCDADCIMECAIALLACLSLVVLTAVALFFRMPKFFARRTDRGPTLEAVIGNQLSAILRPSLTALCVTRV